MSESTSNERRVWLVLNGKSAGNDALRDAVHRIRKLGHSIEVRATWEEGQAGLFTQEAVKQGAQVVVAAGGDGTVNEVAAGLMKSGGDAALAVVPLGTANDFATGCGIPRDPLAALRLAVEATPRRIDVGLINDRPFLNVASAGIGAEVTAETPAGMKRVLGGAAYSLVGLVKAITMSPLAGTIVTEHGTFEGSLVLMAIGNGRLAGGGYRVAPRALLNDGLLDLVIVPDAGVAETGTLLSELINLETDEPTRVVYKQLPSFEIHANREMQMNLDGEPTRDKSFRIQVLPERLPCCLPPEAPLK